MNARKAEPGEPGSAALWPYFLQQGTFLRQSALWCDVWVWHWCSKLWSKRSKHFLQRECLNKFQQIKGYWRSAEYRVWSNAITLTLLSQVTVNQAEQCQAGTKKREIVRHISERDLRNVRWRQIWVLSGACIPVSKVSQDVNKKPESFQFLQP